MPDQLLDRVRTRHQNTDSSVLRQVLGVLGVILYVTMQLASMAWRLLTGVLMAPVSAGGWLRRQVRGTQQNVDRGWTYLTFDRIIPPSVAGFIQFFIEKVPQALGIRDAKPWQQVGAAVTFVFVAVLSTVATGGLFYASVIVAGVLFLIGVARFIPSVNDAWNDATERLPIKQDYNVPRWSRE